MGGTCCGDKATLKEPEWAKAITSGSMHRMQYLHEDNPEIIDEYINNHGICAIHYVVQKRNMHMLQYLLENDANIDIQRKKDGNTPLHIACLAKDITTVRKLFEFNADDTILNNKKKTAYNLCSSSFKRKFKKAKEYDYGENYNTPKFRNRALTNDISIISYIETPGNTNNNTNINTSTTKDSILVKEREKEIRLRYGCVTEFGESIGIDVDEIGLALYKISDRNKLWDKWVNEPQVSKLAEIYKIVYGVTLIALRKKKLKTSKSQAKYIRDLTVNVCKSLPKLKRKKLLLTKVYFVESLHLLLFKIHDQLENEAIGEPGST